MNPDYWRKRWQDGAIGWHQSEVEPALVRWASGLRPGSRILVPLCGKSLDLKWIRDHGHEAVGIELTRMACEQFFEENSIPHRVSQPAAGQADLRIYQADRIRLLNGDFFAVTPREVGPVDAVYDRAALIALPREMRGRYAAHLLSLLGDAPTAGILQIILTRSPADSEGPPHSIEPEELKSLYGNRFKIELLSEEEVEARGPAGSRTRESVYLLRR